MEKREYILAFCLYSAFRFRSKDEKLWKMDENSYFLNMTIYIYIHVGNSQEEKWIWLVLQCETSIRTRKLSLYTLLLGTKDSVSSALKSMAAGSAPLILTAGPKLAVRVCHAVRWHPTDLSLSRTGYMDAVSSASILKYNQIPYQPSSSVLKTQGVHRR